MRRRTFVCLLGATATASAAWPSSPGAQPSTMPVIGFLGGGTPTRATAKQLDAFRWGLGQSGHVEGRTVTVDYRWVDGHYDRLPALAADLVKRRVAVIAAMNAPAAVAAKAATATIPIVFYGGFDPVAAGLVESLARPGGNVTGISAFFGKLGPKRLEMLRHMLPKATAFGLLVNPTNPAAEPLVKEVQDAARTLGLGILVANARHDDELAPAFASLSGRAAGLTLGADTFLGNRRERIIQLAAEHRLPTIYYDRQFADLGGLISYGDGLVETWRQVGSYVGKILSGTKPSDLPILQPTKLELVINLKTAKSLGLTIPALLLAQADEVIE